MGDPSYTAKWRCKECRTLYGHNPDECDVCGHTIFRPLPADGATGTPDVGEETTELGDSVSNLVDDLQEDENSTDVETEEQTGEDETEDSSSLLSWIWPW